jgi:hypothetical protein
MSLHSQNVDAALANHRVYFGESSNSPDKVEYRENSNVPWRLVDMAVVHGEFIARVRKGMQESKEVRRHIFCDENQITDRLNCHIRVGGPGGTIYSITEITRKGKRMQLHLVRYGAIETTRPDYRQQTVRR